MKKIYFAFLLSIIFSCNATKLKEQKANEQKTDLSKINQMDWVLGKWENLSDKGNLYEIWTKINDSTFSGKSFMIANKDTIFSENISLVLKNNELFYIPAVKDQNNALPVPFQFVSNENGEITFENKEHDFPQRIIYKNPKADSLYARIEGNEKGEFRKEEFKMAKSR